MTAPAELSGKFGRYQIWNKIGAGGMGTVYLAEDTELGRRIALKVPHFHDDDPHAVQRFKREARVAAQIEHANLCPVYEVGEINGISYFTMPYIEGETLAARVGRDHPWPTDRAVALVRKLALALAEMHRRGIVHRDLKPGNVMMRGDGEPVLLDFGLARAFAAAATLSEGLIAGTPVYMAPEQFEGDSNRLGPACDVYSLGAILYQLGTGRTPFEDNLPLVIYGRILQGSPPPPSSIRPELDEAFDALCLRALAREPEDRFADMKDFAEALEHYQPGSTGSLVLSLDELEALPPREEVPVVEKVVARSRGNHLGITAAVLTGMLLTTAVACLGYQMLQDGDPQDKPTPNGRTQQASAPDSPPQRPGKPPEKPTPDVPKKPAAEPTTFRNALAMTMVWVRPGKFRMGTADPKDSEEDGPVHEVEITRPFAVAAHETTFGQFAAFVAATNHVTDAEKDGKGWGFDAKTGKFVQGKQYNWRNVGWKQSDRHPVVNVSWNDAVAFCAWLSQKEKATYDLPSEAEWEYVCRAGTTTRYSHGDDTDGLVRVGNVADASYRRLFPRGLIVSGDDGHVFTAPVGQFAANAWGLYDLHGNVWEWCKDGRRFYRQQAISDPRGPSDGPRVLRGGSWFDDPENCRCACRSAKMATERDVYIGFRVVLRGGRKPPL